MGRFFGIWRGGVKAYSTVVPDKRRMRSVARMERSAIRGSASAARSPGSRCAPSGLRVTERACPKTRSDHP
ncbi:hypothetical protein MA20_21850 [Bradyrhizobium japonicum]|uniref:Uncharacterized protein n=1 Tax=Bradyrhizobium japonicum TaxID=375 RepID=A0A0A3XS19_BRAJP|nr:hypothetical protein MA20_21850 [Bradyrhizobium japonicum]